MLEKLQRCTLCPHNCNVDRLSGKLGRCRSGKNVKLALVSIHKYEEPCISGGNGSGTIFFTNCNFNCVFCQNYEISQQGLGKEITVEELADIFIKQQRRGADNINLVTPVMYVYHIIEAIKLAKQQGLSIPFIYNSNGYENIETLKLLKGYIDIYLPDFKYYNNELAKKYSNIDNYFEITTNAIQEMYNQVGSPKFDEKGLIKSGVIIRHLVLPNYIENTKHVLKWIKENMEKDIYVSIMAQYFPTYKAKEIDKLNRKINREEYKKVEKYLYTLNIENGYIQELGKHEEEYVPNFKTLEI